MIDFGLKSLYERFFGEEIFWLGVKLCDLLCD